MIGMQPRSRTALLARFLRLVPEATAAFDSDSVASALGQKERNKNIEGGGK